MSHTLSFNISGRAYEFTIIPDQVYDPNLELIVSLQLGIPDAAIVHIINKVAHPGATVIDAGANIGYFSLILSQAVGTTGKVWSFEPDTKNLLRLHRNLETNKCRNVTVVDKPLWHTALGLALHYGENGGVSSLKPHNETDDFIMLDAVTLDNYLPCRFIKMDIEGAEPDVLTRIKGPEDCPYIVSELNETALTRFGQNQAGFRNLMLTKGYSMFLISHDGSMPVLVPTTTRLACTRANTNVLFSTPELVGNVWSLQAV